MDVPVNAKGDEDVLRIASFPPGASQNLLPGHNLLDPATRHQTHSCRPTCQIECKHKHPKSATIRFEFSQLRTEPGQHRRLNTTQLRQPL